ncbi:MAG: DnaJ domain-containing protein [bacterium]|nr:DnaJ domain-containing protein [bacterium]
MTRDYYAVLSLPRHATQAEIQDRFRELVLERHPDRFRGAAKAKAEKEFQEITEAFNILRDPLRRRELDQVLDRPADKGHDPLQLAKVHINRGVKAYKLGKYIEAADNFDRATQAEPNNHQAWHHLARTCMEKEHWLPKAQEAIVRACELRTNHVPYVKLAARIFLQSGMTSRAKEYYNQLLRLGGSDATVRKALGGPGGAPRRQLEKQDQQKEKSSLFRKMW